jgi:hypothetical protein
LAIHVKTSKIYVFVPGHFFLHDTLESNLYTAPKPLKDKEVYVTHKILGVRFEVKTFQIIDEPEYFVVWEGYKPEYERIFYAKLSLIKANKYIILISEKVLGNHSLT